MTPERIILLIIDKNDGLIRGKTLLQKRAYFLSILLDLDLGYRPHYYGPYSPIIQGTLDKLKATGFVEERMQGFEALSIFPFESRRFDYALTDDGKKVESDAITSSLGRLKRAGDNGDYRILSVAAKTFHVLEINNAPMKVSEIREEARKLGWNISPDQIDNAASLLENLGLVEKG